MPLNKETKLFYMLNNKDSQLILKTLSTTWTTSLNNLFMYSFCISCHFCINTVKFAQELNILVNTCELF